MKSKALGIQFIDHNDTGDIWSLKINVVRDISGKILSGFVIGSTMEQNMATIISICPGELKFSPIIGVGLRAALLSEESSLLEYRHQIVDDFRKDGLIIKKLNLFNLKNFFVDADYE